MGKFKDLTGEKFSRLTVTNRSDNVGRTVMWECLCDCGKIKRNAGHNLTRGKVRSCGCLLHEINSKKATTHGMSKTSFYNIWTDMRTRTGNKNSRGYRDYGGRGIKILWSNFESFETDMHDSYLEHVSKNTVSNTTIERLDPNGDYCKENCIWDTKQAQAKNKRNTKYITVSGETKTVMDLSRESGIPYHTLCNRINKNLPIELILSKKPLLNIIRRITINVPNKRRTT